jgi:hypothetical protein
MGPPALAVVAPKEEHWIVDTLRGVVDMTADVQGHQRPESAGSGQEGLSAEQMNRAATLLFTMQKVTARLYTARSMSSLPEEIAEWWTQYREAEAQLHRIIPPDIGTGKR